MTKTNSTMIIVDDDSDDRLMIKEALREFSKSISTIEVGDGRAFLELATELQSSGSKPQGVILDINMPRMDGVEALAQLRTKQMMPDVPIYVLTTKRDRNRVSESLKYGIQSIYTKPYSHLELKEIINEICNHALNL